MFLQIDSITKHYGHRPILTDIFLSGEKGEVIGLLGRNGSGKSTLMKIIFGSLRADQRYVRVGSTVLRELKDSNRRICYVPQYSFLPSHSSINSAINIFTSSKKRKRIKEKFADQDILQKKPKELSGGQRRLMEIVITVLSEAPIILLDEPFNGISPLIKEEIMQLIEDEKKNKIFLITDHDYSNVLKIATKTYLLIDGKTLEVQSPQDLRSHNYLPL